MWELIAAVLIPILKFVFESINKKKISDKEFVTYILAHQKKRARAGVSALDANEALDEALRELNQK